MATCKNDCLLSPVCKLPFNTSETQVSFAEVCNHFKNKADFVEVVRCEKCVFWDTESKGLSDEHICKMHSCVGVHDRYTAPNDFCSYGERSLDNG